MVGYLRLVMDNKAVDLILASACNLNYLFYVFSGEKIYFMRQMNHCPRLWERPESKELFYFISATAMKLHSKTGFPESKTRQFQKCVIAGYPFLKQRKNRRI